MKHILEVLEIGQLQRKAESTDFCQWSMKMTKKMTSIQHLKQPNCDSNRNCYRQIVCSFLNISIFL